jgi:hypothetical protein
MGCIARGCAGCTLFGSVPKPKDNRATARGARPRRARAVLADQIAVQCDQEKGAEPPLLLTGMFKEVLLDHLVSQKPLEQIVRQIPSDPPSGRQVRPQRRKVPAKQN